MNYLIALKWEKSLLRKFKSIKINETKPKAKPYKTTKSDLLWELRYGKTVTILQATVQHSLAIADCGLFILYCKQKISNLMTTLKWDFCCTINLVCLVIFQFVWACRWTMNKPHFKMYTKITCWWAICNTQLACN